MNVQQQSLGELDFQDFLSPEEIVRWVNNRDKPDKPELHGHISHPGVYRFIFPIASEGSVSHQECYVGETGDLGDRMPDYFCPIRDKEKRDEEKRLVLDSGWNMRGAIQNAIRDSLGKCALQLLAIRDSVKLCGIGVSQADLDNLHARRFLENWGILYSVQCGLYPLNCGVSQSSKDFFRMRKATAKKDSEQAETRIVTPSEYLRAR